MEYATVSIRFTGVTLSSTTSTSTGAFLLLDIGGDAQLEIRCEHPEFDTYSALMEGKEFVASRYLEIPLHRSR